MKKEISLTVAIAAAALCAREPRFESAPYMNPKLPVDERVEDLVSRMEMREKVAVLCTTSGFRMYEIRDGEVCTTKALDELYAKFPGCGLGSFFRADWYSGRNWKTGLHPDMLIKAYNAMQRYAVEKTRLGIPLALGGAQMLGETTIPSGVGIASTWDVELAREAARMNVRERRTFTQNYGVGFPQGTLALDPRWSRVEQTYGEDPFLAAEFVYARCAGSRDLGGTSSLESFICHGMGEGGHMSTPVHVGMNELLNVHMRPFEYAIKGGCGQFMTSYNLVDGIPALLRGDLVNGFVRGRLGYRGTFIADAGAIGNLRHQGFARDLGEAAALAVKAGNDLCCWEAENYLTGLMQAVERKLITEEDINTSLRRVLRGRFARGLFEHPYIDPEARAREFGRPENVIGCPAHREVALALARKSMTLLENPRGTLPLDPKAIRRLAVIGPNADKPENQIGDYTAPQRPGQTITPRLGFEALAKKYGFEVEYALGCKIRSLNKSGFAAAIEAAKRADAVVVCLGSSSVPDHALTQNEAGTAICKHIQKDSELDKDCGEGFDRAFLRLNGVQLDLLRALKAVGKPVVTVLITGRPLVLEDIVASSDAVLLAWYPGTEGGTAIAETVLGLNNPGGKLPISFPRAEGAIPCFYHALRARDNYVDCEGDAAYPFGYGLSYTTFDISRPKLSGDKVSVMVTNTGKREGDEVVQMYIRDVICTLARPLWELRGFRRVTLAPGASTNVTFVLTEKELGFWNREQRHVVEPGEFRIAVSDCFSLNGLGKRAVSHVVKETVRTGAREKVIFDTDIGGDPDDGLALQYLLLEPRCELLGITTTCGRPELAARIASALCRSLGRDDVPIHAGASLPFRDGKNLTVPPAPKPGRATWADELARWPHREIPADASAVEFMRRTIRANPGEVTLFASGQFSNVAALFAADPDIPSLLKRLVIVGGNFEGKVEWNAFVDVQATAALLEGGFRKPPPALILHGAEVTTPHNISPEDGRALMAKSPDFAFVRGHYAEQWYARGINLFFHDPIAAVAIFHPEIMSYSPSAVSVDVTDKAKTRRVPQGGSSNWTWQTATRVDFQRFLECYMNVCRKN